MQEKQEHPVAKVRRRRKAFQPVNVFDYSTLTAVLEEVRKQQTLMDLAAKIGVSHQSIHKVVLGEEHRVNNHVTGWKRALRLKRVEGDYFELLTIIAAYPRAYHREPLLKRCFHLVGRLEDRINPTHAIATSLLYWIDPLCPILRNAVEVCDFPKSEKEIPAWLVSRVTTFSGLTSSEEMLKGRVRMTWRWLKKIGAVIYDEQCGRWAKAESVIVSAGKVSPAVQDIQSAIFTMVFVNVFRDLTLDMGSDRMVAGKIGTLALSSRHFDLLRAVVADFILETISSLGFACNQEDLARLEKADPVQYARITTYLENLKKRGLTVTPCTDSDVDSVVQIVLSARKIV